MPMLTVATYNVNSIRARLERVLAWLGRAECDVVCLQELKVADDEFPASRSKPRAGTARCTASGRTTGSRS